MDFGRWLIIVFKEALIYDQQMVLACYPLIGYVYLILTMMMVAPALQSTVDHLAL